MLACDVNKEWTDKAQEYWHQAGVKHKVRIKKKYFTFLKLTNLRNSIGTCFLISSYQAPILGLIPYAIVSASFSFFWKFFFSNFHEIEMCQIATDTVSRKFYISGELGTK